MVKIGNQKKRKSSQRNKFCGNRGNFINCAGNGVNL